jgi:dCTP deaminase
MAFWRGETIETRGPWIIDDFRKSAIDCNAYTLRMGTEYFCTTDGKSPGYSVPQKLGKGEIFVVPPGQFAFLRTSESITIPDHAMAFISMKATYKFEGLINVSGFHVDPGYKGRLLFSAYNAGPSYIYLREGMDLFLIWFANLDDPEIAIAPSKMTRVGKEKELSRELVQKMGPILSMQSVSDEIYKINVKVNVQYTVFGFAVVFFSALFFALFNHWYFTPESTVKFTPPVQAIVQPSAPSASP